MHKPPSNAPTVALGALALALTFVLRFAAGCAESDPIGGGTGTAGTTGTGGSGTGTGGTTPDPAAPTFTWLYDNMFRGYCSDRNQPCHNPGMSHGVSFSTRDRAYGSALQFTVPGDYLASDLYFFISAGVMPPINPQVPADLQEKLAAWIDAGALDN
jgi:hypothetical protein